MFKKTKEKINNNEYVIIFKKLWGNKRYRSILILVLYFIFFGVIIGVAHSNYQDYELNDVNDSNQEITVLEKMTEWNNYQDNYSYKIFSNDLEICQVLVVDGVVNLKVDDKDYVIINNNIYLKKNEDLKKVNKISNINIDIPVEKLNVEDIMNYVKSIEVDSYTDNSIKYQIPSSYFIDDLEDNISIEVVGFDNLEGININYKEDIIKLKIGE